MSEETDDKTRKDDHTLHENLGTQPLVRHKVFNNPDVITVGWFPACPSSELARGAARSLVIFKQRVVLFRGQDREVRALDAFCPHMGADLGNGAVIDNELQCYFHRWRFDGGGKLTVIPNCDRRPANARVNAYPTQEKYGWIWVFSRAGEAPYPVPSPPGLEDAEVDAVHLGSPLLFAHHHVMMANGIDLQHFATVHDLDVDFEYTVETSRPDVFEWDLSGAVPTERLKHRLMAKLVGPKVGYRARFAGGSFVALTYGPNQRFAGTGFKLPPLHIVWGCLPTLDAVSRVHIFITTKKRKGPFGWLASRLLVLLTIVLLIVLRDDDVKAFPNMRFNPRNLVDADRSVARLVQLTDTLEVSDWSGPPPGDKKRS